MQLFSADTTIFLKRFFIIFFAPENMKKTSSKVAHNWPQFFFQYCQRAQNLFKSFILFHKNVTLPDFNVMTLYLITGRYQSGQRTNANFTLSSSEHSIFTNNGRSQFHWGSNSFVTGTVHTVTHHLKIIKDGKAKYIYQTMLLNGAIRW